MGPTAATLGALYAACGSPGYAMADARGEEQNPDADVIRRVLAGDTDRFERLVERHQRPLVAFLLRSGVDAETAREVTQAAFVRAFESLAGFRGRCTFRTWLFRIALNEVRDRRRRSALRAEVPLDDVPATRLAYHDAGARAALGQALRRWVARLPERQRRVVSLRVFADLPFGEIARAEGITENAAKVNFHLAVRRLRQWMAEEVP